MQMEQTYQVGECLVRMRPKPHAQPGEGRFPPRPARGASSCAPTHSGSPALPACTAHRLPFPSIDQGRRQSPGPAGPWWQDGTAAPWGAPCPLLPPKASRSQTLAGHCGCLARGRQGVPVLGTGGGSVPTLSPCALSSSRRTAEEQRSTCTRACRICRAHRRPCVRRPSGSLVSHNPAAGLSLPHGSLAPAMAAAESTGRLQSPDCPMRGRVPTEFPATLSHPSPCTGGWWEPCCVPRRRPGLHAQGSARAQPCPRGGGLVARPVGPVRGARLLVWAGQ